MTGAPAGWHVSYQRSVEYELVKCPNVLDPHNNGLLSVGRIGNARRFVVVDENIARLHAAELEAYFDFHDIHLRIVSCPAGEPSKSLDRYMWLVRELDSFPIDRRDEPVIAIGGGVVTDLVGFVAGTYRRGVPHISVPTTLIGYVDAAVGIKTGVNLNGHKNRVGAFVPPVKVLLDRAFLKTLPHRHILNGACEILKLAVIADLPLFELLEIHGPGCMHASFQDAAGELILDRSIQRMLDELQPNMLEETLARRMDFGHTFSYGLETQPNSEWLHGEAVLMDVLLSCILAAGRSLMAQTDLDRVMDLVLSLGIFLNDQDLDPDPLWESLQERMLHRNGWQRIPLPHGIGSCTFVNDVELAELRSACAAMPALARS